MEEVLDLLLLPNGQVVGPVEEVNDFCRKINCPFLDVEGSNFYEYISPDGDRYLLRITPCLRRECDNHFYEEGSININDDNLKALF
jgi:hypothetical protein